ncbi:TPA: hypothetical protein N2A14_002564 [Pseudomonas aeruginosa]|nr:hypothetical protein [Pseudomonas aeruginosa]
MKNQLIDAVIRNAGGRFLTVTFRKNDGTVRTINGRFGVNAAGLVQQTKDGAKTYYRIWSQADRGYRLINAENIMMVISQGLLMFNREEAMKELAA